MRFEFKVFMLLVESRGFPELAQERNEHDVDFPLKSRLSQQHLSTMIQSMIAYSKDLFKHRNVLYAPSRTTSEKQA